MMKEALGKKHLQSDQQEALFTLTNLILTLTQIKLKVMFLQIKGLIGNSCLLTFNLHTDGSVHDDRHQ